MNRAGLVGMVLVVLSGCESMSNTEKGVAGGGLIGAGTGALIGNAVGHTGVGALVGAGVGALSGGLVGNAIDESEKKTEAKIAAATATTASPLGLVDIVQMAQAHVSDAVIISQIRATRSVFNLSSNDTIWLKQQGVSDLVIKEMLTTPHRYGSRYVTRAVYAQPVYVVEPARPVFGSGYYGDGWGGW